jgi:gliding motility-associated protein GldL
LKPYLKTFFEMKPGSKGWKNLMAKMYGIGASVVIIGALFKINHYPFASEMLIVGLGTEAIIFFFSAFEKQHEEPDWSLVYPELATPADGSPPKKNVTGQLDDMLGQANIESGLIERLGDGMRHLGDQAAKMGEAADVSAAAKDYGKALNSATSNVSQLADDYSKVSESLTGLEQAGEMSSTVSSSMQLMTENLSSLNEMYGVQLDQLKVNAELYSGMGELVQNLNDSVEDTIAYKENIAELSKNLASLNTVYGNMLNAMGR